MMICQNILLPQKWMQILTPETQNQHVLGAVFDVAGLNHPFLAS
jgi:hypothetical protein